MKRLVRRQRHRALPELQHCGSGHGLLDVFRLQFRQPIEIPSRFGQTPRPIGVEADRDRRTDRSSHGAQNIEIDIVARSRAELRLDRPNPPPLRGDGRLDGGVHVGQREKCVERYGPVCRNPCGWTSRRSGFDRGSIPQQVTDRNASPMAREIEHSADDSRPRGR